MLSLAANVRVYLCTQPVDMRKSFDGLSVLVMDVLQANPLSGALFVFCNRRGDKLKVLYYDGQGLCLWYKRLERGRFRIPETESDGLRLSAKELALLLDGLEVGLAARMPHRPIEAVA
jgi:transposase